MPLPLIRGKSLKCPDCGSEDLQVKRNADHLVHCEVCHRTWDANVIMELNHNAPQTDTPN